MFSKVNFRLDATTTIERMAVNQPTETRLRSTTNRELVGSAARRESRQEEQHGSLSSSSVVIAGAGKVEQVEGLAKRLRRSDTR